MKQKRVSFLIEKRIYSKLKDRAKKQGVPISKIVTSWIQNYNIYHPRVTKQIVQGEFTSYNFWLSNETYTLLKQISTLNSIQISTLLRTIVFSNLSTTNAKSNDVLSIKANRLWTSGQLVPLRNYLYSNFEQLDDNLKILLAKAELELGNFADIYDIHQRLSKYSELANEGNENDRFKLIISEMLIVQSDIESALEILNSLENKDSTSNNKYVSGLISFQRGLIASKLKDVDKGQLYLHKSINSFDIIDSPIELAKSYLYMTDFLEFNNEFETADKYYERAKDIFSAIGDEYHEGWVTGGNAFNAYLRNDVERGKYLANKAVNIDKKVGSKKQQAYSLGVKGRVLLIDNDFANYQQDW